MTYLQVVNEVLKLLREDVVTSVTQDDYTKLISSFVNQAKREVEDAFSWTSLRNTITINTVSGTYKYSLTGSRNRFKILQVLNGDRNTTMMKASYAWMKRQFTTAIDIVEGSPYLYNIEGKDSNGDSYVNLYPRPNSVEAIDFNIILPQGDLTSDSDVLIVHDWPVILSAYSKAISERGEDGGQSYQEVRGDYVNALSDAIGIDSGHIDDELIWTVD